MDMVKIKVVSLFLCLAAFASAQTGTTMGIVGVSRVQQPIGFHIAGMQYDATATNTPATIYGDSLPSGSKIYKWTGSGYSSATYGPVFVPGSGVVTKWDNTFSLASGEGYWVYASSPVDTFMSGNVPEQDSITNTLVAGFQICSYPYPVDRVITNLEFSATSGDKIYVWNGSGYVSSTYGPVFVPGSGLVTKWDNETLPVSVGQGFWYDSGVDTNWIVSKPYSSN